MEFDEFFRILMGFDQAPKNRARRRDLPALLQGWIYFFLVSHVTMSAAASAVPELCAG